MEQIKIITNVLEKEFTHKDHSFFGHDAQLAGRISVPQPGTEPGPWQ